MKGLPFNVLTKGWKKLTGKTKLIIIAAVAVLFAFLFPILCNSAGRAKGLLVGTAIGSFHAVTEDMPQAYAEGKEDGLSAVDTKAKVNKIQEVGKLDVLAANAKMTNVLKDGDKYAALYEMGADVIFSVDVSQAQFLYGENIVEIILPKPVVEFNLDSTQTRLVDDWERWFLKGSSKDGINAYINSLKQIKTNAKEQIANYNYLEERAADSAKQQVTEMAQMLVEPGVNVIVRFMETEGKGI